MLSYISIANAFVSKDSFTVGLGVYALICLAVHTFLYKENEYSGEYLY